MLWAIPQVKINGLIKSTNATDQVVLIGEIAAAYAAGHITAETAIKVAYYRGLVVSRIPEKGAMLAVGLSSDQVEAHIESLGITAARVACINSPQSVTVSGDSDAVDLVISHLQKDDSVFARRLKTDDKAYHSHHMALIGALYEDELIRSWPSQDCLHKTRQANADLETVRMVSSVTGTFICAEEVQHPRYWRDNLESQVRFGEAFVRLNEIEHHHLVEIGPHSALEMPMNQNMPLLKGQAQSLPYCSAVVRKQNPVKTALALAGQLFIHGHDIAFNEINAIGDQCRMLRDLPKSPWVHEHAMWSENRLSQEYRDRQYLHHELLGSRVPTTSSFTSTWRKHLRPNDFGWLRDHRLDNTIVFPAAGYLAMVVEGLRQAEDIGDETDYCYKLRGVQIRKAPTLSEGHGHVEIVTELKRQSMAALDGATWWSFQIMSSNNGQLFIHAMGHASLQSPPPRPIYVSIGDTARMIDQDVTAWYESFDAEGLNFGDAFQTLSRISIDRCHEIREARVEVPTNVQHKQDTYNKYAIHPVQIDAALQAAIISTTAGSRRRLRAMVPASLQEVVLRPPTRASCQGSLQVRAKSEAQGFGAALCEAEVLDQGDQILSMRELRLVQYQGTRADEKTALDQKRDPVLRLQWKPSISALLSNDHLGSHDYILDRAHDTSLTNPQNDDECNYVAAVLDLIAHQSPTIRILDLGGDRYLRTRSFLLRLLGGNEALKRFGCYIFTSCHQQLPSEDMASSSPHPSQAEEKSMDALQGDVFDCVLLPTVSSVIFYLVYWLTSCI